MCWSSRLQLGKRGRTKSESLLQIDVKLLRKLSSSCDGDEGSENKDLQGEREEDGRAAGGATGAKEL